MEIKLYDQNAESKLEKQEFYRFGKYNFTTNKFAFTLPSKFKSAKSIDISCNGKNIDHENETSLYTINLKDRHVFDNNYYMSLKYEIESAEPIASLSSRFHFKVS